MPTSLNKYLDPAGLDETVVNIRQIVEGLEEEMQDLPYARPDGLYPDMTVVAVQGAPQTSQWATRESTGSGTAQIESVQGATVVWNQLIQLSNVYNTIAGVSVTVDIATGYIALNGTSISAGGRNAYVATNIPLKSGHKYLLRDTLNYAESGNIKTWSFSDTSGSHDFIVTIPTNQVFTYNGNDVTCWMGKSFSNAGEVYNCFGYVSMYDLTTMFGSGNEPTTVAEFERMYPEAYYPYSAPTLKPVRIAGIASTDANGDALDGVEWETQTLWDAGNVHDTLTSTELTKWFNGSIDLGSLNWSVLNTTTEGVYRLAAGGIGNLALLPIVSTEIAAIRTVPFTTGSNTDTFLKKDKYISLTPGTGSIVVYDSSYNQQDSAAAFKAAMAGVILYYATKEPIVTSISPALPMTYRVQAGGSESIIVPDGEISAAPLLTISDPLNVAAEFARVWEAIGQLQSSSAAQLSRPVSLADAGSVDEVQNDTTEIETVKEVKE